MLYFLIDINLRSFQKNKLLKNGIPLCAGHFNTNFNYVILLKKMVHTRGPESPRTSGKVHKILWWQIFDKFTFFLGFVIPGRLRTYQWTFFAAQIVLRLYDPKCMYWRFDFLVKKQAKTLMYPLISSLTALYSVVSAHTNNSNFSSFDQFN